MALGLVRLSGQFTGLTLLLAVFLASGPGAACSIWSVAGEDHHHHRGQKSVAFMGDADHCAKPQIPCREATDELPELKSTVPSSESQEQSMILLATLLPAALIDSDAASRVETDTKSSVHFGSFGDFPASRRAALCRFLV